MRLVEWMQVLDKEEMPLSRRQKLIMAVGGALFGNNAAARQSKVILEMKINIGFEFVASLVSLERYFNSLKDL